MTQEAAPGTSSSPVPSQRAAAAEPTTDHVHAGESARSTRPVTFDRLLSVVVLTPAQASLVAVELLEAARPDGTGNGRSPAGTHLLDVTLTPDGGIEVRRSATGAGTSVAELLDQVLQSARRLPAHPRPEQLVLLRGLEEAVGDPLLDPEARARALERTLVDALGPGARQLLTTQLAALVDAFGHIAPGVPAGVDPPPAAGAERSAPRARTAADRRRTERARPATNRAPRRGRVLLRRRTRGRAALVVLVAALVLAVSGYVVLGGTGSDIVGSFGREDNPAAPDPTTPDRPAEPSTTKPDRDKAPRPVRALAPRQAGAVTGVALETAGSCRPGSLCPVTVTVRFRPASTSRTVGWRVGAARVCKPGIAWSGPVTVTAQPGWTTVYASSSVRVPKGRRLALTALTTTPARAQSRPVPVANASLQC